jgi:hypothetical protein
MNNNNNEKIEKIIEKILQLYDKGKTLSDMVRLFPEHQNEAKEIMRVLDVFQSGKKVVPPRELLSQILADIKGVTENEIYRLFI